MDIKSIVAMLNLEKIPKVSVMMTVYQQKEYVADAIESVLAQDYPNLELIIGDDGSTDGTQDILTVYQKKFKDKIKLVLSENNEGITANCNKLFKECSGEYIAFQAGDDIWLPGKLTKQVYYMQAHPECSICYHNLEVFDHTTGNIVGLFNNASNPPRTGGANVLIHYGCFNGAVANVVRRSKCPSYGFDPRIPIASDWLFWIETLLNDGEIHYIDQALARYRIVNNSASNTNSEKILNNFVDHLNSLSILLIKKPAYYQEIFFRIFEIYNALSNFDRKNRTIYKLLYRSRRLFFVAISFAKLIRS